MRREPYLASVIVLLLAGALAAGCASTSQIARPSPAGEWEYVIPNTPQGDAHGTLMVASERDAYSGEMYIDILDQTVPMEEVAFTDSTFTFTATLDANGQRIGTATRMTLNGNTLKGTIQAEGIGELEITATRKMMDDVSPGDAQNPISEDWRMDLRDLVSELSRRHVDLYHSISKDSFEQAVAELDRRIPSLSRAQILVEVAQLVALIGDGHTSFFPGDQRGMEFQYYPMRLWSFSDGMYVIAASEDHADVLGKRLIQIDNTSIEDAFAAVSTTVSADNDMEYHYTVPF